MPARAISLFTKLRVMDKATGMVAVVTVAREKKGCSHGGRGSDDTDREDECGQEDCINQDEDYVSQDEDYIGQDEDYVGQEEDYYYSQ